MRKWKPQKSKKPKKISKKLRRLRRRRLAKKVALRNPRARFMGKYTIDYKNLRLLRHYITVEGKILPRRLSRLTAKKQRKMATEIKTARVIGFLPFIRQ